MNANGMAGLSGYEMVFVSAFHGDAVAGSMLRVLSSFGRLR